MSDGLEKRHIITRGQIEYVFMCLRHIDRAIKVLETQQVVEGRDAFLADLRETADKIYTTVKETPEAD